MTATTTHFDTDVLIVGGGPVGLTLAIDLGRRGVECILLEKKPEPQFLPKMERVNARSMELFRRIGLADTIRTKGLRTDASMDVYLVTALNEPPLLRVPFPSVEEARVQIRNTHDGSLPLEPYQLISQYTMEPLLKSIAEKLPGVDVRFGTECAVFQQNDTGVSARTQGADGKSGTLRTRYLIGCDGGTSPVRQQLGIKLQGEGPLSHLRQGLFYCEDLYERLPIGNGPGRGRHWHVIDDRNTVLVMQDSTKHWSLHSAVESDEAMHALFGKVIGVPMNYEMLSCSPWRMNLLLAERYRAGRVFLAGDACHLVIPTGGLGMNTGVGDAFDLSWKLAATLQGWGGPNLLDSYEIERRQVGERNVGASRFATRSRRKWRSAYRPEFRDSTPAGAQVRNALLAIATIEQNRNQEMTGAELGYRYADSPIVMNIPGGPQHLFQDYEPSTWPGARLPHMWLNDGSALHDRIPTEGYTILRLGTAPTDAAALEAALRSFGTTVTTLVIPDRTVREVYEYDLFLLRPDLHIAWRGNALPDDVAGLASTATGH